MESEEDKSFPETKKRRLKTPSQLEALENFYAEYKYPSEAMKARIAMELGLSDRQVQGWFCHRRLKDKKLMKEEALNGARHSSGSGGGIPDTCNGAKQESSGSGKTGDQQSRLSPGDFERKRVLNPMDYAAAVLASELGDHELLRPNTESREEAFGGSSTVSQERSPLQSVNPGKVHTSRHLVGNGNHFEVEPRLRRPINKTSPEEQDDHEAIIAVKKQLGAEYREDGPVLGVVFHSPPSGAFSNASNDSTGFQALKNLPKETREDDYDKAYIMNARGRSGHSLFSQSRTIDQALIIPERKSSACDRVPDFVNELSSNKYVGRLANNHYRAAENYHVPDLNSSMQVDEDCPNESLSSIYSKKNRTVWYSPEAPGRQSPASQLPYSYGSRKSVMSENEHNKCKEFSVSHLDKGIDPCCGIAGANNSRKLSYFMPPNCLHSPQDLNQSKKVKKKERIRGEMKNEKEHFQRLKQKYISKGERMVC
eukprot:TRINITY_DN6779_c0_g1_i1.p1 TRINITY_DN6779_c0_g1~~TRINITY_DN6779_c0_g1_i1.p1  ORF type:complete len:482 (+),score=121.73 TRINITY_DN6779_c0_g1_i1:1486-2931(+)